ncbi:MAG: membrane protein insertion efficiency factor YidD [Rhodospirillales bacterium]|nr:membrane protein insertion efficiency factor YidD [Rhodospirillales bacterium]MBT4006955.1 membrane protein insertion efficiency factor YidD [Rhodospirillales bacterium]MBT5075329.1 membrane protein insertion efficiency factor YidD [Rhodospirillales bacterium]MBT5113018.1 membrane protein insertion efficiency factor YidD [Rhodospirillales bacterium]MBT5672894.1 membrane protein insertion efficiency factor YidD [Rhodospirillales bacterium]
MGGATKITKSITICVRWTLTVLGMALIWAYRLLVAPLFPASCRFNPSCSAYGMEALKTHGPIRGSWLTIRRILRCHPWGDHGHDPVPEPDLHLAKKQSFHQLHRGRS